MLKLYQISIIRRIN